MSSNCFSRSSCVGKGDHLRKMSSLRFQMSMVEEEFISTKGIGWPAEEISKSRTGATILSRYILITKISENNTMLILEASRGVCGEIGNGTRGMSAAAGRHQADDAAAA